MAYEIAGQRITLKLQDALEERYVAVKVVGDDMIAPAAAGDIVVGFAQLPGRKDEGVPVQINGVTFAVASAAIAAGSQIIPAANGRVATGTTGVVGVALTSASAAGDIIAAVQRI